MRIVNRATFLAMPPGTLFCKYMPCVFEALEIKGETMHNDYAFQGLADAITFHDSGQMFDDLERAREKGDSLTMDLDCMGRDGMFDADQLFAVYEHADLIALIDRLAQCVPVATNNRVTPHP